MERSSPPIAGSTSAVWRATVIAAAVVCLGGVPAGLGLVQAGEVSLDYELGAGAERCPNEIAFRQRTADLYEWNDPFVPAGTAARWRVRIDIRHDGAGYHGSISLVDPATGKETARSSDESRESCDALVWWLSHLMTLVIGHKAVTQPPPVGSATPAEPPPPAPDPATQRRLDALEEASEDRQGKLESLGRQIEALKKALEDEKKRKMDLAYALSTGAFLTANLTSNVGPGVWVGGELRAGPLALGLELRSVLPSRVAVGGPYDLDVSQFVALLTPCGRYSYFFGCAVAGAGTQIHYDSNFPGGSKTGALPLVQLGGRLGVEVPFGESMFGGRAWGEVLYSTPQLYANYIGTGYKWIRPDVSAFFGIGLVVKFGKEGT